MCFTLTNWNSHNTLKCVGILDFYCDYIVTWLLFPMPPFILGKWSTYSCLKKKSKVHPLHKPLWTVPSVMLSTAGLTLCDTTLKFNEGQRLESCPSRSRRVLETNGKGNAFLTQTRILFPTHTRYVTLVNCYTLSNHFSFCEIWIIIVLIS